MWSVEYLILFFYYFILFHGKRLCMYKPAGLLCFCCAVRFYRSYRSGIFWVHSVMSDWLLCASHCVKYLRRLLACRNVYLFYEISRRNWSKNESVI